MNRYLRGCLLFSLLVAVLLLPACTGKKTEEPHLKIVAGEQEIKGIYYGNQYDQTSEELEKRLEKAMEGNSWEELPYVALKETITIEAENFQTEEFTVSDYILTKTGAFRYDEKVVQTSVVPLNDGKATITLSSNPAANLSSNSEDYEPGKTIRGFVLRADIEGSSFTFAFIVRSDANIQTENTSAKDDESEQVTDLAWEIINRDIANYESNPEIKINDSKIIRLEKIESFDALADKPIYVYALEYRLLPEDLSKVVLAGGMDYDEEGWLKETCSMGSPLLVITNSDGEVELLGTLWTGGILEEGGLEESIKALLERN